MSEFAAEASSEGCVGGVGAGGCDCGAGALTAGLGWFVAEGAEGRSSVLCAVAAAVHNNRANESRDHRDRQSNFI